MSEESEFEKAMALLGAGRRHEARADLWRLYASVADAGLRLQIIDALMSALPLRENDRRIAVAEEGIHITRLMKRQDLEAYMMARRASFLANKLSVLKYHEANLKLAPGWIGFATESEKIEHEGITETIQTIRSEIDTLLQKALKAVQKSGDRKAEAHVWMSMGEVSGIKYMHFKMDAMRGSLRRIRWWNRLALLRRYGLENYLFYNWKQIKRLWHYIAQFTECFLRAARLFRESENAAEANALYNLSNYLKSAFRFREARKYLPQAKAIAQANNDQFLSAQIVAMEQSIKARNKDIPNYLEGETRDSPTRKM